jgi:hypothetical protein
VISSLPLCPSLSIASTVSTLSTPSTSITPVLALLSWRFSDLQLGEFGMDLALVTCGNGVMLKISLIDSPRQRRVIVEGKLIAPSAAELRNVCRQASIDLRGRELIVEMKHVTDISQEAKNVILDLINEGIKFRSEGVFTKHVMKELSRRARRNLGTRAGD